jgi:putative transposase
MARAAAAELPDRYPRAGPQNDCLVGGQPDGSCRPRLLAAEHRPRRPKLNWADRALLATLLAVIPKARRHGLRLLVAPDTILRWHRDIIRRRWAARSIRDKTGRPATRRNIRALVLRLARENPGWGYRDDPW